MITKKNEKVINNFVDEYLDECRFDFIWIDHHREIQEVRSGEYVVRDTDIVIDRGREYDVILSHPVEDFFLPESVDLYVTEYTVKVKPPELEELVDFDCAGVLRNEEIFIDDPRISDAQLVHLLSQICFDSAYQKFQPEVTDYLREVYSKEHSSRIKKILARIRPLLDV